jgi:hypothetical protein
MTNAPSNVVEYRPAGPTLTRFHQSNAFVRLVVGPIGSGKSVATGPVEILRRAREQAPGPDGIRRTRWVVIRNTYAELMSTTIRTYNDWCPTRYGRYVQDAPITHQMQFGDVDLEVNFLSADREADMKKLLSFEATGIVINEAGNVPRSIFNTALGRVGRYPAQRNGGCTWSGVILDSNPVDVDHWIYKLFVEEKPPGFELFKQPGGRSPDAENLKNLPPDYYPRLAASMPEQWVRVYVDGEWGFSFDGQAVFPEFKDSTHSAREVLKPYRGVPVLVGVDFGLTPAAVLLQQDARGRWLVLHEIVAEDMAIDSFGRLLHQDLQRLFPGSTATLSVDPAGQARSQVDARTPVQLLKALGFYVRPAPTNDLMLRLESVRRVLSRLVDGIPGIIVSPNCVRLRKALAGGYHYQRLQVSGAARFKDAPAKDEHSHVADALQYALMEGGEARALTRRPGGNRPEYSIGVTRDNWLW